MNGDSSPSSPSGSDEENESNRKRRGRRGSRPKNIAALTSASATSADCSCFGHSDVALGTSSDPISKRHTIHVENPNEQQRQSRRALNLNDDLEPQVRTRAMSQGRRALDSHHHTVR